MAPFIDVEESPPSCLKTPCSPCHCHHSDCQGYGKGQINIFLVEAAERRGISVRGGTTVLQLFTATNNNNRIGLSLKLGTLTSLFLLIGLMDRFAPAPQGFLQKRIVGIDVIF